MAGDKYIGLINGLQQQKTAVQSSSGAGDAGKITALDASGLLNFDLFSGYIQARTSAGGELRTSSSAVALHWGSGGSANGTLYGGWNYDNATASTMVHFGASKTIESKTYAQTTALLDAMVGDSGSGGTKGLVPAPAAGDAAANKVLGAAGAWVTVSGSSPLTTKGDLYTYTTTNARLAVGTDGYALVADSTQAAGIKWAAVTASAAGSTGQIQYNNSGALGGWIGTVANTIGGASSTDNFLNITATMPTTMSATTNATNLQITSAGSSAFQQNGMLLEMLAGYTGGSPVNGIQVNNNVAGTGASYGSSSSTLNYRLGNANCGARFTGSSSTSGINNGGQQLAAGSSTANYGSWTSATSSLNTPALNVGIMATALNATTNTAGAFMLIGSGTPSLVSAALLADNGATTSDIFVARDNGTAVFTITDAGVANHQAAKIDKIRTVTAAGAVTVSATDDYIIEVSKTSGAATTVNLPASPATGLTYVIKDGKFDAATYNITITPNAGNIDNASTYVMNQNGQSVRIVYNGTQWLVIT